MAASTSSTSVGGGDRHCVKQHVDNRPGVPQRTWSSSLQTKERKKREKENWLQCIVSKCNT
jgi:hypothetical protein